MGKTFLSFGSFEFFLEDSINRWVLFYQYLKRLGEHLRLRKLSKRQSMWVNLIYQSEFVKFEGEAPSVCREEKVNSKKL